MPGIASGFDNRFGVPYGQPTPPIAVLMGFTDELREEVRIDILDEADPFSLKALVGQPCGADGSPTQNGLLLVEATELAHGRRHLTVVHGDPGEVAASRHLSGFYEELRRLAAGCEWVRVRGNAEYVTVTVGGALAEEQIALFEAAAAFANPGDWTIVASAVPPLS